ncbi:MAG TPA: hypothetical protein DC048_03480, partial [Planctomycetaceae bacterium]|nr:hypothetical protein [Planctomycetaceae bacterium]
MYDLLVAVIIALGAWFGSVFGIVPVAAFGLEIFGALTAGVLLHEPVGGLLAWFLRLTLGAVWPDASFQGLGVSLSFFVIVWGTMVLLRFLYHPDDLTLSDSVQEATSLSLIERVAGGAAGGAAGYVTAGAFLVTCSMLPLPRILLPAPQSMFIDAGSVVLRAAGRFQPDTAEGQSLVALGEPLAIGAGDAAPKACEPWIDLNGDGEYSETDRWYDSDGNGAYTAAFAYVDADGDGTRRIGLVEKYATATWH